MAIKSGEVANTIKALNDVQLDVLMKYIYKGMAFPEYFSAGVLLGWHERALAAGGLGSIIRVMSDKQSV